MVTGEFGWEAFLRNYNRELLTSKKVRDRLPAGVAEPGWMGFAGATEKEITAVESRIGTRLPPSYRQFLGVSNGWRHPGPFVYYLWPTARIAWFQERNQIWIDAYVEPSEGSQRLSDEEYFVCGEEQDPATFRVEYLQTALEISDTGDSAVYLLNPQVVTPDGEWEAWFFANWNAGANRYRSFYEMMQAERERFLRLLGDVT